MPTEYRIVSIVPVKLEVQLAATFPGPISPPCCGVCVISRGRPTNAPAAFIQLCRPTVASNHRAGDGWAHELKHDGYRLQVHVRDGRVRLYT